MKGDKCSCRHDFNKRGKYDTVKSVSEFFRVAELEKCVENPKSQWKERQLGECFDGLARITSKELARTHFLKVGTLQNACSTRPRVVAGLERSALMHTVRLMNFLVKGPMTRVAVALLKMNDWHEHVREPVVNHVKGQERLGRPDEKRDHELKRGPTGRRSSNPRQLACVFHSSHEAVEVYSPEEL